MLYSEFIYKAKELTVQKHDNGTWYLEPEWHDILHRNGLGDLEELSDSYLDGWYTVEDVLKLEVERRNTRDSQKNFVISWLYDLITATVEPAILQEETDYIKNLTEYLKVRDHVETNKEQAAQDVAG